jgi:hypothetical protein
MGNQKSRPQPPPPTTAAPIPSVVKQIDILQKRLSQKEALIRTCAAEAKRLVSLQDTAGALHHLRTKKRHETEITRLYIMMDKLTEVQQTTESAKLTSDVLRVTQAGTAAIQSFGLDVDKADAIVDASRDAIDTVNDVAAVFGHVEVDSDIERELKEMMSVPQLPSIPTHVPITSDDEIVQLQRRALSA